MEPPGANADFEAEVLRINRRYNLEFVEAFALCPYAMPARKEGTSLSYVLWLQEPQEEQALHQLLPYLADPAVEVLQIIFPLLLVPATVFQRFVTRLGSCLDKATVGKGKFVLASFHPELPYSCATAARLVPFFRRSPDPLVQVVRLAVLDAIHQHRPRGTLFFDGSAEALQRLLAEKKPSVTEHISSVNYEAALGGKLPRMEEVLRDIDADRAQAYAPYLAQRHLSSLPGKGSA
jgi:hypothetical protein